MRMDPAIPTSAADILNWYSETQLERILTEYGEENYAAKIAYAIVTYRRNHPFINTKELADLVSKTIPTNHSSAGTSFTHPATKTFQALRIAVNDELRQLDTGLEAAFSRLIPGGSLIVVSFQALEDKVVKEFMKKKKDSKLAVGEAFSSL